MYLSEFLCKSSCVSTLNLLLYYIATINPLSLSLSDKTQSIIKIIVVMFYVKISCHIKMLKYYTNNVLLGRQAYVETLV